MTRVFIGISAALGIAIVLAAVLFAASAGASTGGTRAPDKAQVMHDGSVCYDDMRCWNWALMGNHKRGVVLNTPDGEPTRRAVLGVCSFNLHDRADWIDWTRTPRLRGDKFAREMTDCPWRLHYPWLDAAFPVL